MNDILLQT